MAGGLIALLDDVAALARLAAASTDDVAAAAARAGSKTLGVVIDDAAVAPSYVVGLPPERELPIIGKITLGSLRNKLLFILPAALLLSSFAPWAITPILMLGGLYLSFEGAEKIIGAFQGHEATEAVVRITDPAQLEARQVSGAIRTDFILSGEIMIITLNDLTGSALGTRAFVLAVVGVLVTLGVYGVVGIIVKMDDVGLRLVQSGGRAASAGRALVAAMPVVLTGLSRIGTAAMLWVGGGILIHSLASFHVSLPEATIHSISTVLAGDHVWGQWAVTSLGAALVGLVAGAVVAVLLHLMPKAP